MSAQTERTTTRESTALRFPWSVAPVSGQVQEVADGVFWLRMPLPLDLDHINLYLLQDGPGWVVVDTGMNTSAARMLWEKIFTNVLDGQWVRSVICTHFHYDHTGLANWLCERFSCPLYMTHGEYQEMCSILSLGRHPDQDIRQFYQHAGLDETGIAVMLASIKNAHFDVPCPREYQRLHEGMQLDIGGRQWQIVIGSGHSPEHACLYCKNERLLISGDQVLPRITSCVCVGVFEPDGNPLNDWLESLKRLHDIPDDVLVLPAHELPFYGLHQRLSQLSQHHRTHLDHLLEELQCSTRATAAQLRPVLFPVIKGVFDLLMALGETLAHLNFMVGQGQLVRELESDVHYFRPVA